LRAPSVRLIIWIMASPLPAAPWAFLLAAFIAPPVALAQDTVVVAGRVTEAQTGEPVPGVELTVEGSAIRALTDAQGSYRLVGVPAGPRVLRARRVGYAVRRVPVAVPTRGTITVDLEIATSALMLEGITVTGEAVSRATGELGTATVIESEAIRNQTATSVRGVLELVPGVEAQPAGIDDIQQVALRVAPTSGFSGADLGATANSLATFGTLIILDGVPLSNNANLQVPGRGSQLFFATNAGGGIDLRSIPARTIERVEVIRGVPSARYGDLTQGAVIVETRAGVVDPEVAVQFDERTIEASLVGGRSFGGPGHAGTAVLDLSRTKSAPGVTADAARRLAGQLSHRVGIGQGPAGADQESKLVLDTRVDAYELVDDRPSDLNQPLRSRYTRDRALRVSERARLALTPGVSLWFTGSLSVLEQRSQVTYPLTRGPGPITDQLTEGRSVGRFALGPYVAAATMDGGPRLLFGRLESEANPGWLGLRHDLRLGVELRREWNGGAGYQFDILNPPQVTFNGVNGFARPRAFNAVPPLVTGSVYLDDRVTRSFGARGLASLQAGVRLDLLNRGSHWFSGVRDAELGPRVNLEVSPHSWLRLRAGWGLVTKAPWLDQLHPATQYYDVINVNWFTNDPAERLAVLTTFVRDPTNPDLGFAVAEKTEAGLEVGPGRWALSLVAFRDRIRDGIAGRATPGFVLRDHYDLADSTRGTGVPPTIVEPAAYSDTVPILLLVPDNILTVTSRGLELQAVLPEIPLVRTRLHVTGQWIETRQEVDALYFGTALRFGQFAITEQWPRTPYWGPTTEVGRRMLVTYRAIHHQPALGLVLTGIVQHNVSDRIEDLAARDTLAWLGYLTRAGELVAVAEADRASPDYQDLRIPRPGTLTEPRRAPGDWMLSVQVSKTFPLGGRFSFWAFNLLDRRGIFGEGDITTRLYQRVRFGLELTVPVRGLIGWAF